MNKPKPGWARYWLVGTIVAIFGLFGIAETIALLDSDPGDTYSESIRYFLDSVPGGKWIFAIGMIAFTAWFVPHIIRTKSGEEDKHDS